MDAPAINYTWEWDCQLRIHKPKRANKKFWVDWVARGGKSQEQMLASCQNYCREHGWTLLEVIYAQPMRLGYAFWGAEPYPNLSAAERQQHLPKPAAYGTEETPKQARKTAPTP
jgi:hypothetical protein